MVEYCFLSHATHADAETYLFTDLDTAKASWLYSYHKIEAPEFRFTHASMWEVWYDGAIVGVIKQAPILSHARHM